MLISLWKEANEKAESFVDHAGVRRDAKTGKAVSGDGEKEEEEICEST